MVQSQTLAVQFGFVRDPKEHDDLFLLIPVPNPILYPDLHVGAHEAPDASSVLSFAVQSPVVPFTRAWVMSQPFAAQLPADRVPFEHVDMPDNLYPLLHVGRHFSPSARDELQLPAPPLLGAVLALQEAWPAIARAHELGPWLGRVDAGCDLALHHQLEFRLKLVGWWVRLPRTSPAQPSSTAAARAQNRIPPPPPPVHAYLRPRTHTMLGAQPQNRPTSRAFLSSPTPTAYKHSYGERGHKRPDSRTRRGREVAPPGSAAYRTLRSAALRVAFVGPLPRVFPFFYGLTSPADQF